MDQTQDQLDPEIAQEMITLLNRKITNLRSENARLQNQLEASVRVGNVDEGRSGISVDHTNYLQGEINRLRSELDRRRDPGEVSVLEDGLKKGGRHGEESSLRSQAEQLRVELGEAESARQNEQAVQEALREEIQKLRDDLNERTKEKEEALAQLESQRQDTFDVDKFLRGELQVLPPKHDPIVVTGEGIPKIKGVVVEKKSHKQILSANGADVIKWANDGGGCVVPCPPVVYNGGKNLAERARKGVTENGLYELFGADGDCNYYGTYRCIKVTTMDWDRLKSLGQEFASAFLETTVIQDGHAAPVIRTLMKNMYTTGILKGGCAVLLCEGFNEAIMEELQPVDGPSKIGKAPARNGGKRPHINGEGSQGATKKRKFQGKKPRNQTSYPMDGI